jgi:adenine/guanine phosphoribosyltransferase-like PRPP-binding protein
LVISLVLVVGCQSGGIPIAADAGRDLEVELVPQQLGRRH